MRGMARVNGVNHVAIVVNDMRQGLLLYRDILGLPVVSTTCLTSAPGWQDEADSRELKASPQRLYNLDMGGGTLLTLVEIPSAVVVGRTSFAHELWPGDRPVTPLGGTDHVSMSVDSEADLIAIRERLIEHGFDVGDVERLSVYPFWKQLRFHDDAGNDLEISTWDYDDPAWPDRRERIERESLLFQDPEPL
jgi:catechol 2,3-dioxygenase-like lactoylglutathione lyase family enzyme